MAPKRKYKRGRRAVSFKAASEGLRAGERRIAEQSKIQINALKEQQLQQANIDKLQIKGHADKAAFEEGVQKSKFQLNEMSRDLIVENMNIRADRDVDRLRGIANEYEKKAKHLAQLAPKQAKAYALILEAWQTSFIEEASKYGGRVRDMPLDDRFECTTLILVRKNQGIVKYLSAKIDTDSDGKRKLREWETGNVQETRICITEW